MHMIDLTGVSKVYPVKNGGTVVAQGTPADVATVEESFTGQYLAEVLAKEAQRDADGS